MRNHANERWNRQVFRWQVVARSFDDLDRGVSFTDAIDDVLSHVGLTSDSDSDCVSGRSEPGAYRWSSALGTHVVAECTCLKGWGHTERTNHRASSEGRVRTSIRWPS